MSLFHRHKWTDTSRKSFPPLYKDGMHLSSTEMPSIQRVLHGYTIIEQRCECGDVRHLNLVGVTDKEDT